ncbi:MAG: hypothetical protein LIP77_08585, partial [Planctomycetes bacterium]|nr:hypothetical protein [Planctomycetota bacterium]
GRKRRRWRIPREETAMRMMALIVFAAATAAVPAGEFGSRTMAGWFHVTTPDGWIGRRYMDGGQIFAEEFDSNGDGRLDVWRFYRRGLLSSEERDLNGDGRVNFQSRWDGREGRLVSALRDTDSRGVNDLEIEALAPRRWEIREDRNHDGITDRVLFIDAPPDIFEALGIDLASQRDIIDSIPVEYWRELWSDDAFTTTITEYRRFTRGTLSHYGEWNGRRVVWRAARDGDGWQGPARRDPTEIAEIPDVAHGPNCPIPNCPEPMCQPGWTDTAPVGGLQTEAYPPDPYPSQPATEPFPAPDPGQGTALFLEDGGYDTPYFGPGYVEPRRPAVSDRTRYDSVPPGESAARSVPARMRMPGPTRR